MPKRSLAEKIAQTNQSKARIAQREAQLKKQERQERTRTLTELGSLAERAGINHLPTPALLGGFLRIASDSKDPVKLAAWESEGRKVLEPPNRSLSIAVARFPAKNKLEAPTMETLRQLGFRWNRLLEQWEGRVALEEATPVVAAAGGKITKLNDGVAV